jgi:hypothetical protein
MLKLDVGLSFSAAQLLKAMLDTLVFPEVHAHPKVMDEMFKSLAEPLLTIGDIEDRCPQGCCCQRMSY